MVLNPVKLFPAIGFSLFLAATLDAQSVPHPLRPEATARGAQSPSSSANSDSEVQDLRLESDDSEYDIIHIDIPGAVWSQAAEITNRRIVSGAYGDTAGGVHSFLWFHGLTVTVDKPGEAITAVAVLSDSGLLFGNWGTETVQHAGYYNPATAAWTQLPDISGYALNLGSHINDKGDAVGYACSGTFDVPTGCVGWFWDGSKYDTYSVPGAMDTFANGINNKGTQVGLLQLQPGVYPGYRRVGDRISQLFIRTASGLKSPTAYDINENGKILGVANLDPNGYFPSIIFSSHGAYKLLPKDPTVVRTFYLGMNDKEDLAGSWFNDPAAGSFALIALRKHLNADH